MAVGVAQPGAKKSNLDVLQQALGVASTVYGVGIEQQKLDALNKRNTLAQTKKDQVEEDAKNGVLDQGAIDKLTQGGAKIAPRLGPGEPPPMGYQRFGQDRAGNVIYGKPKGDEAAANKITEKQSKAYVDANNALNNFRGNKMLQQANLNTLSAKNALDQLEGKDFYTTQDIALFNAELGKMASNGIPGEHTMAQFEANNINRKLAEGEAFLTGKPTDAQADEYLKRNVGYLEKLQKTSQGELDKARTRILHAYTHQLNKDDFNQLLTDYPELNPENKNTQEAPRQFAWQKKESKQQGIQPPGGHETVTQGQHQYNWNYAIGKYE